MFSQRISTAMGAIAILFFGVSSFSSQLLGQDENAAAEAKPVTVANDDQLETSAGTSALIIEPQHLLKNDVGVQQRKLHICDYDDEGLKGELQVRKGIGFIYLPSSSFKQLLRTESQIETFKYQVHDGSGGSDWATVQIKVTGTSSQVSDYPAKWDVNLTEKTQQLIEAEIVALGKRAKESLSPAELQQLEEDIDRQLDSLRKWSKDLVLLWEGSTGPFFSAFFKVRPSGTDIKKPPVMLAGPGIPGMEIGFGQNGRNTKFKARFNWTSGAGAFGREWTEKNPVDEEYRVFVTGRLHLEIFVERVVAGKRVRVDLITEKDIFENQVVVLKGSAAVKQAVIGVD